MERLNEGKTLSEIIKDIHPDGYGTIGFTSSVKRKFRTYTGEYEGWKGTNLDHHFEKADSIIRYLIDVLAETKKEIARAEEETRLIDTRMDELEDKIEYLLADFDGIVYT